MTTASTTGAVATKTDNSFAVVTNGFGLSYPASLYVNGVSQSTAMSGTAAGPYVAGTTVSTIGRRNVGGIFYYGSAIYQLLLTYNRQLSALEIAQLHANPWQILAQSSPRSILAKLSTASHQAYTEILSVAAAGLSSVDDRLTLVEAATVLCQAGASLGDVVLLVEAVTAQAMAAGSVIDSYTGVSSYVESILTAATAIPSATSAQFMAEGITIVAQAGASVADTTACLEQVTAAAAAGASVIDAIIGQFVGRYLHGQTVRPRLFTDQVLVRPVRSLVAPRQFTDIVRPHR